MPNDSRDSCPNCEKNRMSTRWCCYESECKRLAGCCWEEDARWSSWENSAGCCWEEDARCCSWENSRMDGFTAREIFPGQTTRLCYMSSVGDATRCVTLWACRLAIYDCHSPLTAVQGLWLSTVHIWHTTLSVSLNRSHRHHLIRDIGSTWPVLPGVL